MNKLEILKQKLFISAEADACCITARFEEIADLLFNHVAVKKGGDLYHFADVEFYYYNPNHRDIITHARNCEAMQWYVNDFGGIDLSFKSETPVVCETDNKKRFKVKPELTDNSYFGGILIRELRNVCTGDRLEGPWACAELFRIHDATGSIGDFPVLVEYESAPAEFEKCHRLNLKRNSQETMDKVRSLVSAYANRFPDEEILELCKNFDAFNDKEKALYRYRLK